MRSPGERDVPGHGSEYAVDLPGSPSAAREARGWLRASLVAHCRGLPERPCAADVESGTELADVAELLLTEVVTNAVLHARSSPTARLHVARGRLLVHVTDSSPAVPTPVTDAPRADGDAGGAAPDVDLDDLEGALATSGRGLDLLDALADEWGWRRTGAGKVVWFSLRLPGYEDRVA